jgi:hypothetical protein
MIEINEPHSMDELKRLTDRLAAAIDDVRLRLHGHTLATPEKAARAYVVTLNEAGYRERSKTMERAAGRINSALSNAETTLQHAADDLRVIYHEARLAGVSRGVTW